MHVYGVNVGCKFDTSRIMAVLLDTTWKTDGLLRPAASVNEEEGTRGRYEEGLYIKIFLMELYEKNA